MNTDPTSVKKRYDFRMAVGSANGPRSSVWHFFSRKSEVYAVHGGIGGIEKFSFHTPNLCLRAFTSEHGKPQGLENRVMHRWRRDDTPPPGLNRTVRVLRIGFSTHLLSTALEATTAKEVSWVPSAPTGGSTVVDLMFTRDSAKALAENLKSEPVELRHTLLAYNALPNGEAFALTFWHAEGSDGPLRMPASHGHKDDLIVFPEDPQRTGRPVRLTTFSKPKDGEMMSVWEMGAFWHLPLTDEQWADFRISEQ